jgi:hypothetical protein
MARAGRRWSRLFERIVEMESGFGWTPFNQHLPPDKAMQRHIGRQPKNFQIRYAELRRQLQQAERIIDGEDETGMEMLANHITKDIRFMDLAYTNPILFEEDI